MLVLSRRLGEKIMIGEEIVLTVVEIDHGRVRLGITAPRDVPITRPDYHGPRSASAAPVEAKP